MDITMDIGQVLTLLLGGGLVATLTAAFNGIKSLREGSRARERDTITDLINRRNEADENTDKAYDARDRAFNERDYWRNRAGAREYQLLSNGIELNTYPPPPAPVAPEEPA